MSSRLKYDYRWYLNRMINIDIKSLWEKEHTNHELEADSLSVTIAGLQALQGGITYMASSVIHTERNYNGPCIRLLFLLFSKNNSSKLEDRLTSATIAIGGVAAAATATINRVNAWCFD